MNKILLVSTVGKQFYLFEKNNIRILKGLGYEVHCAANFEDSDQRIGDLGIIRHNICIQRSPYSSANLIALFQLIRIMCKERYKAVHCHTPMGGVLSRIAAMIIGNTKIIYTAHGFHFFRGSSIISWFLYFPVEYMLASITDVVITINPEDYYLAKRRFHRKSNSIEFVPGIGIDLERYQRRVDKKETIKNELGIPSEALILLSVGELNNNKNHEMVIRAISMLKDRRVDYVICGDGRLRKYLEEISRKYGVGNRVHLLGFKKEILPFLQGADVFVLPSKREGLPVSLMEAMACSLPVLCSNIRGNRDLIVDGEGGFLFKSGDVTSFISAFKKLTEKDMERMGENNHSRVTQYSSDVVITLMKKIYRDTI